MKWHTILKADFIVKLSNVGLSSKSECGGFFERWNFVKEIYSKEFA